MVQSVDHVALLPAYLAAGTVLLVLLTDLVAGRRAEDRGAFTSAKDRLRLRSPGATLTVAALGAAATAAGAVLVGRGPDRVTFCVPGTSACSYRADNTGALIAVLFALLTLGVLAFSAPILAADTTPPAAVTGATPGVTAPTPALTGPTPGVTGAAPPAAGAIPAAGGATRSAAGAGPSAARSGQPAGGSDLSGSILTKAVPAGSVPAGEYCFLLVSAMTGGVVLGYAADLITLIIGLETLTLPLYILVGLRRRTVSTATSTATDGPASAGTEVPRSLSLERAGAEGAVTFFVVSVVATAVTLLGAALLYALTGAVHFTVLAGALATRPELRDLPLTAAAVVLVLAGLAFKVAAVPFHAWAPAAYDGAPVPVAAYLSTASKLGGVVAIVYVAVDALRPWLDVAGPALAALAVLTMTVGNLVALRQRRMVRLLAWSSVAQAGYILAPLGAAAAADGRTDDALGVAVSATIAYTVFYVVLELAAFGAVVALRPAGGDGGEIADYRGAARRAPWVGGAFVLALIGLAGLPPALAGLFAKVVVVRSLLDGGAGWLAVVVALNAVVGLAYYVRVAAVLFTAPPAALPAGQTRLRVPWLVAAALTVTTLIAIVIGFAPQLVLDAANLITAR